MKIDIRDVLKNKLWSLIQYNDSNNSWVPIRKNILEKVDDTVWYNINVNIKEEIWNDSNGEGVKILFGMDGMDG